MSRSVALFVRMRRQCSRGVSQYVSVSVKSSRTTFAASLSSIDSSSPATDSAFAPNAPRGFVVWIALSMAATWERLDLGGLGQRVAVEAYRAALVFGPGEHLGDQAHQAGGLVAGEHAHASQDLADALDAACKTLASWPAFSSDDTICLDLACLLA